MLNAEKLFKKLKFFKNRKELEINVEISKECDRKRNLQIANFNQQLIILTWKNLKLLRRSFISTAAELLCPFLFISIIFIIRHFIERLNFSDQIRKPISAYQLYMPTFSNSYRNLVMYYPNNTLIKDLISDALLSLIAHNPNFVPICN
jgi:hypothetical protein